MEHARQWFVDLSRFMMGGSQAGCEEGGWEATGGGRASFRCRILKDWKPLDRRRGPGTAVLFKLIVLYFSTLLLCVTVLSSTEDAVLAFTLNSITSLPGLRAVFQIA